MFLFELDFTGRFRLYTRTILHKDSVFFFLYLFFKSSESVIFLIVFSIYSKVPQIQWMLNIFLLNKWVFEQIKEYSGWRWLLKAVVYWFKSSHAFITFSDKFEDTVGSQPFFQLFQFAYNCQFFFSQFLLSFLYWVSYSIPLGLFLLFLFTGEWE